jgi:hypothetical protein
LRNVGRVFSLALEAKMPRNIFYRDFTAYKAIALVALIGLSAAMGGVPDSSSAKAEADAPEMMVIPAMLMRVWTDCDADKKGVEL